MPEKATLIAELRGVIADLRADRDAWREQAHRLALPAPKPVVPAPKTRRATAARMVGVAALDRLNC